MLTIEERVAKGATLLDEYSPEWFNNIDLNTLSMDSYWDCILGQLFGSFVIGVNVVFRGEYGFEGKTGMNYGYDRDFHSEYTYEELQNEWVRIIIKRRRNE